MLKRTETKVGRPTILTKTNVQKVEEAIRLGLSVQEACSHAEISRSTFYNHIQNDERFLDIVNSAKAHVRLKAMTNVLSAIEKGDLKTSMWYLDRISKFREPEDLEVVPSAYQNVGEDMSIEDFITKTEEALMAIKGEGKYAPILESHRVK